MTLAEEIAEKERQLLRLEEVHRQRRERRERWREIADEDAHASRLASVAAGLRRIQPESESRGITTPEPDRNQEWTIELPDHGVPKWPIPPSVTLRLIAPTQSPHDLNVPATPGLLVRFQPTGEQFGPTSIAAMDIHDNLKTAAVAAFREHGGAGVFAYVAEHEGDALLAMARLNLWMTEARYETDAQKDDDAAAA